MTCFSSVALLALLLPAASADWQMDRLMISVWGGPTDEASAQAYAAAGFNTVMCPAASLDLCRKVGLRAIVMDATPQMAAQKRHDRAVWGWFVQDEPPEDQFEQVAQRVAAFHAADPDHPAYVNLMAWMPLSKYMETVKPRFLSYDYYQWWWGTHNACGRLEVHREAALKAGVPLICWVEANADPRWEWGKPGATYLPDNAPKLRQSVMLALAYGVRGIQWFNESLVFSREPGKAGELTASGRDIQAINADVRALGPVLMRLRSEAVYHTDPVPDHARPVPDDLWVQPHGRHITFGLFRDEVGGQPFMLVNRDIQGPRVVIIAFPGGVKGVERYELASGDWRPLRLWQRKDGTPAVTVRLAPGDGMLLRPRG